MNELIHLIQKSSNPNYTMANWLLQEMPYLEADLWLIELSLFGSYKPSIGLVYMAFGESGIFKGKYKIGFSKDPESRIKTFKNTRNINGGYGTKSRLISTIDTKDPRALEGYIHGRFMPYRVNRKGYNTYEWFDLPEEQIVWFKKLSKQSMRICTKPQKGVYQMRLFCTEKC